MRVVRRTSLGRLLPLPDGLSFTPAMTARAVTGGHGEDCRDRHAVPRARGGIEAPTGPGRRALPEGHPRGGVPLPAGAPTWDILGLVALSVAVAWMLRPIWYYVEHHRVQEWMIYRFLVSHVLGTIAALLLCASYLTAEIVKIARSAGERSPDSIWSRFLSSPLFWLVPAVCFLGGGALVLASFLELLRTGGSTEHWSRFVAMSFFWSIGSIFAVTRVMDYVLDLLAAQLAYERQTGRRRRGRSAGDLTRLPHGHPPRRLKGEGPCSRSAVSRRAAHRVHGEDQATRLTAPLRGSPQDRTRGALEPESKLANVIAGSSRLVRRRVESGECDRGQCLR